MEQSHPQSLQKGPTLTTPGFQTSSFQNCETQYISVVLSQPVRGNLLWQPQRTNTNGMKEQLNRLLGTVEGVIRGHSWCKNLAVTVLGGLGRDHLVFWIQPAALLFKRRLVRKKKILGVAQELSHAIVRETRRSPKRPTNSFCPVA